MSISKYNSEGYPDPTAHDALATIEQEQRALRAFRPIVYICSPYSSRVFIALTSSLLLCLYYTVI